MQAEIIMKTYNNLYPFLCSMGNLILAWRKAKENKIFKAKRNQTKVKIGP